MSSEQLLIVLDTPGIKQFVFGTDALAEIRGASALLDWLNREKTESTLRAALPAEADLECIFVGGGTGQFLVHSSDRDAVNNAVRDLARLYRDNTGDDVRIVWGVAPWGQGRYKQAVRDAHFQMRLVRETAFGSPSTPLLPFLVECSSTSHLPAEVKPFVGGGGQTLILSRAAREKREETTRLGPWADWMEHLYGQGPWPERKRWRKLRFGETNRLDDARIRVRAPARKGYVGLIYADGNAMGRLVQELDSPENFTAFSNLVDNSLREACHEALDEVCKAEIARQRMDIDTDHPLPADILLLGGDDLLVLLAADVALAFALHVTKAFEENTRRAIAQSTDSVRGFFEKHVGAGRGLTLSCGVALAPARYPFYLLYDLADDLLKSAKQGGNRDPQTAQARAEKKSWSPSYIDFHLVVGSAGADLEVIREEDYRVGVEGDRPRTLRPYRHDNLEKLQTAVGRLQEARLPRSKLQDLYEAALDRRYRRAEMRAQELFGRLRQDRTHHERQALWLALGDLGMTGAFPWCGQGIDTPTALADLVEACDLFPQENREEPS